MKTLDFKNVNVDCFGNPGPFAIEYIWPIEKGGADIDINKITISTLSIQARKSKSKGYINYVRYSIRKQIDKQGNVYGVLLIQRDDEWFEVQSKNNL